MKVQPKIKIFGPDLETELKRFGVIDTGYLYWQLLKISKYPYVQEKLAFHIKIGRIRTFEQLIDSIESVSKSEIYQN